MINKVAVTGATGFIGQRLCAALSRSGFSVVALTRPGKVAPPNTTAVSVADLGDANAVARALVDVHAVVHLAARVHVMRDTAEDPLREFRRVNVAPTQVLLDAAQRANVQRFIYISSVKAVGEERAAPIDEHTPPEPSDPYGMSKLEAERLVLQAVALRPLALRLPMVYGPGMKGNMMQLFRLIDRGLPIPLGGVRNQRSIIFVDNVIAAIETALRNTSVSGVFGIADAHPVSTPDLIREIGAALGRPARLVAFPTSVFDFAGMVGNVLARAVPFPLTTAAVQRLTGSLVLAPDAFHQAFRYQPPFTLQQGLAATAAWYRASRSPLAVAQ
jgi:nucleoside-diphosphate-sugar epimerase